MMRPAARAFREELTALITAHLSKLTDVETSVAQQEDVAAILGALLGEALLCCKVSGFRCDFLLERVRSMYDAPAEEPKP